MDFFFASTNGAKVKPRFATRPARQPNAPLEILPNHVQVSFIQIMDVMGRSDGLDSLIELMGEDGKDLFAVDVDNFLEENLSARYSHDNAIRAMLNGIIA